MGLSCARCWTSYSRIIESLAFTVLSRIEDVLYSDSLTYTPKSESNEKSKNDKGDEDVDKWGTDETPTVMTLSDFMRWSMDKK